MSQSDRLAFFELLATRFGPNRERLAVAVETWQHDPTESATVELAKAAESRRQELFRRLNLAPGGTAQLVEMRRQLIEVMQDRDDLRSVDADFVHLFTSWFNRGFLLLRRIDWSTPASVLEKIIRYEAVHAIGSWAELRGRIDPPDRRCYAFFHPALVDEPLVFVQVALTRAMSDTIGPVLATERQILDQSDVNTAVFYSITSCQRGLVGISFGHFLIKQVAEEISREFPRVSTFVTLSPIPGFSKWLAHERTADGAHSLDESDRTTLQSLDTPNWHEDPTQQRSLREPLLRAAAVYLLTARGRTGKPRDPVARFHLGNGARLERINWLADVPHGLTQSHGLMVNYLYDLARIEQNHEAYAEHHTILASSAVRKLVDVSVRGRAGGRPVDDSVTPAEDPASGRVETHEATAPHPGDRGEAVSSRV